MFFMSKKRFEEEVFRRVDQEREKMYQDRRIGEMSDQMYRHTENLERRLLRIEEAVFKKRECIDDLVMR